MASDMRAVPRRLTLDRQLADDQRDADADQTSADADQTSADADQTYAERDHEGAVRDQRAADRDQASADASRAGGLAVDRATYEATKRARDASRVDRLATQMRRTEASTSRETTGIARDRDGSLRDATASRRNARERQADRDGLVAAATTARERLLLAELDALRQRAAADRAKAAAQRAIAAREREASAAERTRLQNALISAYTDDLTGAFRREMGWRALELEIDRARRGDGRFVLAFIDVDGLKAINDRAGHAAGDAVLKAVVAAMRSNLRSFDPIVRYGGDEFVCGMGGVAVPDVRRRFAGIGRALRAEAEIGISVGLAALAEGDDLDAIVVRADADMLNGRRRRTR